MSGRSTGRKLEDTSPTLPTWAHFSTSPPVARPRGRTWPRSRARSTSAATSARSSSTGASTSCFGGGSDARLLLLSGTGGSGKSAALREAARRGERLGYHVIALDGRQLAAAGPRLADVFADLPNGDLLVLVDELGHIGAHAHALGRTLAALPGSTRVVTAAIEQPQAWVPPELAPLVATLRMPALNPVPVRPGAAEPRRHRLLRAIGDRRVGVRTSARAGARRGGVGRARCGRDRTRGPGPRRDRGRPGRPPVRPGARPARPRAARGRGRRRLGRRPAARRRAARSRRSRRAGPAGVVLVRGAERSRGVPPPAGGPRGGRAGAARRHAGHEPGAADRFAPAGPREPRRRPGAAPARRAVRGPEAPRRDVPGAQLDAVRRRHPGRRGRRDRSLGARRGWRTPYARGCSRSPRRRGGRRPRSCGTPTAEWWRRDRHPAHRGRGPGADRGPARRAGRTAARVRRPQRHLRPGRDQPLPAARAGRGRGGPERDGAPQRAHAAPLPGAEPAVRPGQRVRLDRLRARRRRRLRLRRGARAAA